MAIIGYSNYSLFNWLEMATNDYLLLVISDFLCSLTGMAFSGYGWSICEKVIRHRQQGNKPLWTSASNASNITSNTRWRYGIRIEIVRSISSQCAIAGAN